MKLRSFSNCHAYTLVELLVSALCATVVISGVMVAMNTGTLLFAKNVSTNASHNTMRSALDRISMLVDSGTTQPTLIDINGNVISSGSAAGIRFDKHLGGPYVVNHPGGTGLSASATSFTIARSLHSLAAPPIPKSGDVLLLDGNSTIRVKVSNATAGTVDANNRQNITVTLSSAIGTAIKWDVDTVKTARLVRAVAFVVVPKSGRNQLRLYESAEGVTNFATATGYETICDIIGPNTGDNTPFSYSTSTDFSNRKFLNVALRIRARDYDQRLAKKESNNFSSSMRLDVTLTPKGT